MREIKFRAWSKTHKKMYDRVLAGPGDPCSIIWDEGREEWVHFDDICGEIMQFTGLKDRTGKEIYEGDVCRIDDSNYEVYWNDDRWGLREAFPTNGSTFRWDYDNGDYYQPSEIDWNKVKIIGNIYENQDLLRSVG